MGRYVHPHTPPTGVALAVCLRALQFTLIVAAAIALVAAFTTEQTEAGGPALMALDMDPATPGIQDHAQYPEGTQQIAIDVVVQNAQAIGAFEFWLSYNPLYLQFLGWNLGPFLTSTGRIPTCHPLITENTIRIGCTPRHVPAVVLAVDDLPRTRSGKLAELAVTDAVNGREVRNTSALANPETLEVIASLPGLRA